MEGWDDSGSSPSVSDNGKEWPAHPEVRVLFAGGQMYIDTGDQHPFGGTVAYKVRDADAQPIIKALQNSKGRR